MPTVAGVVLVRFCSTPKEVGLQRIGSNGDECEIRLLLRGARLGPVDEVLGMARARTGLDDFGDDSFRDGLERFVRALQDEAR